MVRVYSKAINGNEQVSENFKVKEFACKDGSDKILISEETVSILQSVRNLLATSITITSGYRTPEYNRKVGGAPKSQHVNGLAADTKCKYGAYVLARAYQLIGATGIGLYPYSPFAHVDTRDKRSYWQQDSKNGYAKSVSTFILKSKIKNVQEVLNLAAKITKDDRFSCGNVDGVIGPRTNEAFRFFCNNASEFMKKEVLDMLK